MIERNDVDPLGNNWSPQERHYRRGLYAALEGPLLIMNPASQFDLAVYTLGERLKDMAKLCMHEISRMEAVDGPKDDPNDS